ncbi:MAG: methionyl-tRNA formyltransferase [Candidatus Nanopelagicales bacterium]
MRLLFAGTPDVAVPSLRRLLQSHHEVVAVLTRPDAPVGRGRRISRSPVAQLADEAGVPVLQPATLRDPAAQRAVSDHAPDLCPVVAYGSLVPSALLGVPEHGWVNLHFSLLPAWRGAAPVQHAVWHGDDITGATTFRLDEGMDTGPVFGTVTERIGARDTAGDVLARLAESGAGLLAATIDGLAAGDLVAVPQPADGASLAPKIDVTDARVVWTVPDYAVDRQVRACTPAPGAWTTFREDRVKIGPVTPVPTDSMAAPGELVPDGRDWAVGTATGAVRLGQVQPAGKKMMAAGDWLRGVRPAAGERFA